MATCKDCKDCFHYELCGVFGYISPVECGFYTDRSQFVKLPCNMNAELFRIKQINGKAFVTNTTLNQNTFWKIVFEGEFGKTVFLTREEAEEALKERGKDE